MEVFNITIGNPILSPFLDTFALSPLNIDTACFKNSKNPGYLDISRRNFKPSFIKTNVFETDISDHHIKIFTTIKLHFTRESPTTKYCRDCRKFDIGYVRCKKVQLYLFFGLIIVFLLLREVSAERLHPIFRHFINNLKNIVQCNGTLDEIRVITW